MKKPNVIYILTDDMGYGDVSALNENCGFKTPHLDRMCREGIAFCDAHSTSAVCTPSRYGLLTGRYNWRSRMKTDVLGGYSRHLIEPGRTTLGHLFRRNGYHTAAIGKWHLGMDFPVNDSYVERPGFASSEDLNDGVEYGKKIQFSPITNGFDYFYGIAGSLDMPPYVYIENDRFTAWPDHYSTVPAGKGWYRPGPTAPDFVHERVLDDLTDKVIEQIENNKEQPFFIYYPMPAPHGPILPGEKFRGRSCNAYTDYCLRCDDAVGRIVSKLEQTGLYENTVLVFTADNGCAPIADFEELAAKGHNPSYVFRGAKADIYEGGHRIPFIVQWPDRIKGGAACRHTVCLSDFMATMAEILGDELAEDEGVDSVSNYPLWKNPEGPAVRKYTVHQSINGSLAVRMGDYKLEMCPGSGGWSHPNIEESESMAGFQLYNLREDIGETTNVIDQYPEIYRKMRKVLKEIVENGRSTPGPVQANNGEPVWKTISWILEKEE